MERTRCVMVGEPKPYYDLRRILDDLHCNYTVMEFGPDEGYRVWVLMYEMDLIKHQWILSTICEKYPDDVIEDGRKC